MHTPLQKRKRRRPTRALLGFSLVEVMFVLAIFTLVLAMLAGFMVEMARGMKWATNKASTVRDVRSFTMRITNEAFDANAGIVYPGFALAERNDFTDRRASGLSGDCLVLVHKERFPTNGDPEHYTKIVAFFRLPNADGVGPVHRAEVDFDPPRDSTGTDFETFLASVFPDNPTGYPVVLELSRGLSNGSLFQNRGESSFLVNGEILHGTNNEEVTNTYNLTISPRG